MIDPATLCSIPGHTGDPTFVTRDYSTHRADDAGRKFFVRVCVALIMLDGGALAWVAGRILSWW